MALVVEGKWMVNSPPAMCPTFDLKIDFVIDPTLLINSAAVNPFQANLHP